MHPDIHMRSTPYVVLDTGLSVGGVDILHAQIGLGWSSSMFGWFSIP